MRFRDDATALLALPWHLTLAEWPADAVRFVELPVGESRHVVRFISLANDILALKELPIRPAQREYAVMRDLQERGAPAVRPVGLVERPDEDAAILVTRYLSRSLQLRRLFRRLPEATLGHRERLLDAMTNLLVELHRGGVFWGDCSLANTLLLRDGQSLQAHLVDAETSEIHPTLSEGQRRLDVELAVENVAGDLLDIAATAGRPLDDADDELAAARSLRDRYERLWSEIHRADALQPGRALPRRGQAAPSQCHGLRGRGGHPRPGRGNGRCPGAAAGGRRLASLPRRAAAPADGARRRAKGRRPSCSTTSRRGRVSRAVKPS